MIAYHGTDYEIAKKICSEGFTYKPSEEHWLGNGVYLYRDHSLAKWWTTNPTNKFGSKVKEPAIVCCSLKVNEEQTLNLLKLDDYTQFSEIFEDFYFSKYKHQHPLEEPKWQKLRCVYCDYLARTYDLDMIIGNFDKPDQPYLPPKHGNDFDNFLLQYTEVQICIFNKSIITDMTYRKDLVGEGYDKKENRC